MNLVLSLFVLGGGALSVWGGITDPQGGIWQGLARALRGEPAERSTAGQARAAGFLANVAAVVGGGTVTAGARTGRGGTARTGRSSNTGGAGGDSRGMSGDPFDGPAGYMYHLRGVRRHVARAANELGPKFGITTIGGYRTSATDMTGHPAGLALDLMTRNGQPLANYARANARRLGVKYVIWNQRIWSVERSGEGWRLMEDRGSATANHKDHVHISFYSTPPAGGGGAEV